MTDGVEMFDASNHRTAARAIDQEMNGMSSGAEGPACVGRIASKMQREDDSGIVADLIAQCKLLDSSKTVSLVEIHGRYANGDLDMKTLKYELRVLLGRMTLREALIALGSSVGLAARKSSSDDAS